MAIVKKFGDDNGGSLAALLTYYGGGVVGGVGWRVLQYAGGLLVEHTLRNSSQVYGFFAAVLGLLAWIYLGARLTLYAAESNVVRTRHLWPAA